MNASALESCVTSEAAQFLPPKLLPKEPMQIGRGRLDTQVQSDHLQITDSRSDLRKQIGTCLQSECSLRYILCVLRMSDDETLPNAASD